MITAAEARQLAGPTNEEILADALNYADEQIREAANTLQREAHLHGQFWAHGGYDGSKNYRAACDKLEKLGYTVTFYYKECQFVDMYTVVKW